MRSNLYKNIAKSVSGKISIYIVQFLSLIILARIFSIKEFGILASIQVFVIFFQMISDIGIGPALISEKKLTNEKINGIYTVTFIMGTSIALVFYCFSFFLNYFYSNYDYKNIAILISISIIFNSLNIIPKTALIKDLKFITVSLIDVVAEVISFIITIILYSKNYGVLALASRTLTQSIFRFFVSFYLSSSTKMGKPRFGKEVGHIKSILSYSIYQFGFNFINYFSRNLDNILIAKFFGLNAAGIYDKSYQLMRYPLMLTTFALTPAIQPTLIKKNRDVTFIKKEHNKLACRLLILTLPISVYLGTNAENIVIFLFGEKWLQVASLIELFSVIIPFQAIMSTSGAFFQTMNRPDLLFKSGLIVAFITVTMISFGVFYGGIYTVAASVTVGYIFNFFFVYHYLFKYVFKDNAINFYVMLLKVAFNLIYPVMLYIIVNCFYYFNFKLNYGCFVDLIVNGFAGSFFIFLFKSKIIQSFKCEKI